VCIARKPSIAVIQSFITSQLTGYNTGINDLIFTLKVYKQL